MLKLLRSVMLQFLPQIQTSPFEKIVLPYGHLKGLLKIQKSVVCNFYFGSSSVGSKIFSQKCGKSWKFIFAFFSYFLENNCLRTFSQFNNNRMYFFQTSSTLRNSLVSLLSERMYSPYIFIYICSQYI